MNPHPAEITVRYWAGARAAVGIDSDTFANPGTVAALRQHVAERHPSLRIILSASSVLVSGVRAEAEDLVPDGGVVEILPPFAGG